MNELLEPESNKISTKLKIFYITIIAICVIAIIAAVILQIQKDNQKDKEVKIPTISTDDTEKYKNEFNSIFQNKVNYLKDNGYKITKVDESKEIIYTGYEKKENKLNSYDLNVSIPYINIKNDVIEKYNQQIISTFERKAKSVLNTTDENVVFTVNYSAYVSNNILSLVIRATLKEGTDPQRDMIQTYNFDLINQKEYTIDDILEKKGLSKREANEKIKEEITKVQQKVEELRGLGYSVYTRDLDNDIYNISNVTEYFIGEDNALYVIFAYGNQNKTSEMDIVIM